MNAQQASREQCGEIIRPPDSGIDLSVLAALAGNSLVRQTYNAKCPQYFLKLTQNADNFIPILCRMTAVRCLTCAVEPSQPRTWRPASSLILTAASVLGSRTETADLGCPRGLELRPSVLPSTLPSTLLRSLLRSLPRSDFPTPSCSSSCSRDTLWSRIPSDRGSSREISWGSRASPTSV